MMLVLKGCPRCHGDVERTSDQFGPYVQCLNCSWLLDLDDKAEAFKPLPLMERGHRHKKRSTSYLAPSLVQSNKPRYGV